MKRWTIPGVLAAALACLAACALLLRAATLPVTLPAPPIVATMAEAPEPVPEAIPAVAPSPDALAAALARPAFAPGRRPPAPPAAPPAAPSVPTALPVPVGTVITAERRLVLLRLPGQTRLVRVGAGDSVAGWRVEAVLADRVEIRGPAGEQHVLPLARGPRPGSVPPAPIPLPGDPPPSDPPAPDTESDIVRTVEEIIRAANQNRAPRRRAGERRARRADAPPGRRPARPTPVRRVRLDP